MTDLRGLRKKYKQPFELDYFQTFFTLCDILVQVYQKILGFLGPSPAAPPPLPFPYTSSAPSSNLSSSILFGHHPTQPQLSASAAIVVSCSRSDGDNTFSAAANAAAIFDRSVVLEQHRDSRRRHAQPRIGRDGSQD
jgi:hypothetical protein